MAAAVIPLVAAFEPLAVELVVKLVDKLLGSKTGSVKKQVSTAIVQTLGQGMVTAGQAAAGQVPDATGAATAVQATVDKLNALGVLQGAATVIAPVIASANVTDGLAGLQMMLSGYFRVTAALAGAK